MTTSVRARDDNKNGRATVSNMSHTGGYMFIDLRHMITVSI
jgi:hypothetical protein